MYQHQCKSLRQDFPVALHIWIFSSLPGSRHVFPATWSFVLPTWFKSLPPLHGSRNIFPDTSAHMFVSIFSCRQPDLNTCSLDGMQLVFLSPADITLFQYSGNSMIFLPPSYNYKFPPPLQGSRHVFPITTIQMLSSGFACCLTYLNFYPLNRFATCFPRQLHTKVRGRNFLSLTVFKSLPTPHSSLHLFPDIFMQWYVSWLSCSQSDLYFLPTYKVFGMIFLSQAGVTYFICEVRGM